MAKRRMGLMAALVCICLLLMPAGALAVSTEEAKEPIRTDRECALSIYYGCDGVALSGAFVEIYEIAGVSGDAWYTLSPAFESTGLVLNGVRSNGEWNVIRSTLEAYILANAVPATLAAMTDEGGYAAFDRLKPGLYLVSAVRVTVGEQVCSFDSTLIALPGLDAEGAWQYDVSASAKPEILPPPAPGDEIEYRVLKLWKGDEGESDRPTSIEVEIFRDGFYWETVFLSDENNWAYSWTAPADGAVWTVVERYVPDGYTVTMEQRETTFVLTNTRKSDVPDGPEPPKTGDTSNILLYSVLMFGSGAALVVLGLTGKREGHEKN